MSAHGNDRAGKGKALGITLGVNTEEQETNWSRRRELCTSVQLQSKREKRRQPIPLNAAVVESLLAFVADHQTSSEVVRGDGHYLHTSERATL